MQVDPTITSRVNRMDAQKANRIRTIATTEDASGDLVGGLPDVAEDGDAVLFAGQLHVMSEGDWRNIDDSVMAAVKALTERVSTLEGTEDG